MLLQIISLCAILAAVNANARTPTPQMVKKRIVLHNFTIIIVRFIIFRVGTVGTNLLVISTKI